MKKTKRATKIKNILLGMVTFAFACMISLSGIIPKNSAKASSPDDSAFLYEPVAAVQANDTVFALDTTLGKVITISDGEIEQSAESFYQTRSAKDLVLLAGHLILISPESTEGKFTVLSTTFESQNITDTTHLDEYEQEFSHFSVLVAGNTLFAVFFNDAASDGLLFTALTYEAGEFDIIQKRMILVNNEWHEEFESALGFVLCFDSALGVPFGLITTSQSAVRGFYLDGANISSLTAPNVAFLVPEGEKLFSVFCEDTNFLIYKNNSHLCSFSCAMETSPLSLDISADDYTSSDTNLTSISNIFVANGKACFVSMSGKQIEQMTSTISSGNMSFGDSEVISNPEITVNYLSNRDISFHEIVSNEARMVEFPYSTQALVTLPRQTKLIMIGKGFIETTTGQTEIQGYDYFMATVSGTNYYGFIEIDDTFELEVDQNPADKYVYIRGGAKIYKYPSRTIDTKNTLTETLDSGKRFEIFSDISNYSYSTGGSNCSFVQVILEGGETGYIESTYVQNDAPILYVQTNAKILRTTNVYKDADTSSTVITSLSETKRVRMLENRTGNKHFTKIAFNDEIGNYYEGYILSENVKADSWSTLQIIGFVLVTLSILLLAIILIIKSRVAHQ